MVFDGRYRYIRNFDHDRPHYQFMNTPEQGPTMIELRPLHNAGKLHPEADRYFQPKPVEQIGQAALQKIAESLGRSVMSGNVIEEIVAGGFVRLPEFVGFFTPRLGRDALACLGHGGEMGFDFFIPALWNRLNFRHIFAYLP